MSDKWRGPIGSAAIAIAIAYMEGHKSLRDSDALRIEFAEYYLKDYRFMFKYSDGEISEVS